jgi:hypothetical protein
MADATVVVGIDEAGYGPVLGPLTVSASAFEVPAAQADSCLWQLLRQSVSPSPASRQSRIAVLDSKKLYRPKDGLARLERSVLSVIAAWRDLPSSMHGLLDLLCPEARKMLEEYPWYRDADDTLPTAADAGGIRIASSLLARDLDAQSVRLAGCWSEVLPEGHYNRLVDGTRNKAVVLSGLTLRLVQRVADAYPDHQLRINIDKQGARDHYARLLLRAFDDRRLRVLEESPEHSAYELTGRRASWRVGFSLSGESRHLPVALASMLSKYLRELLMGRFNAYWKAQVPALKPTAGYYRDGLRFLGDIRPHLARLGIAEHRLVRQR